MRAQSILIDNELLKNDSKFEIILINDEKEPSAKEALPCKDCIIDYVSCSIEQDDHCDIDFA